METDPAGWRRGRWDGRSGPPMLLFGRTYEDPEIEAALIPPGTTVFCLASAGCCALALAQRGCRVTAVDANPAQVAYVEERLRGAPPREGRFERMLALTRRRMRLLGAGEGAVREFLMLDAPAAQERMWRNHPDAARWRAALRELVRAIAGAHEEALLARLERGLARHSNRTNPFAWRLLLGVEPGDESASPPRAGTVGVLVADAIDYLEAAPPRRFGAFALSNLEDLLSDEDAGRLRRAVAAAAAPGAITVTRGFGEPRAEAEAAWAERDRSLLWGRIAVNVVAP